MSAVGRIAGLIGTLLLVAFFARWWSAGGLDAVTRSVGVVSSALLIVFAVIDGREEPAPRKGVGPRALSVGLFVLAAATAVAAAEASRRVDRTWDLRADPVDALQPHTIGVLTSLSFDVEIYAFFANQSPEQRRFRALLRRAAEHSDRLQVTWADPLREPRLADELKVDADHERGQVVIRGNGGEQRLGLSFDQAALSRALARLASPEERRVCWTVGHGEADPDADADPRGFGTVVLALESEAYSVVPVNTMSGDIPASCDALVVARPVVDFLPFELDALARWTKSGGRTMVVVDRGLTPNLGKDLARYGVHVGVEDVADRDPAHALATADESVLVVLPGERRAHPITRGLPAAIVLGGAVSVRWEPTAGLSGEELFSTGPRGVEGGGEEAIVPLAVAVQVEDPSQIAVALNHDPAREVAEAVLRTLQAERPSDVWTLASPVTPSPAMTMLASRIAGRPIPSEEAERWRTVDNVARSVIETMRRERAVGGAALGAFAERPGGRILVLGDGDFATNQLASLGSNRDLFLGGIGWLVEDPSVGARAGSGAERILVQRSHLGLLFLNLVLVIPGLALAAAALRVARRAPRESAR